jgi:L-lactate dehydrogenase complex protein LldG
MERAAFLAGLRARLDSAPPLAGAHPPPPPPASVPRVAWQPDPRPLTDRFADALSGLRARLIDSEELPGALAELDVRTAVSTTDALALPPGIERLDLGRAREADAGVTLATAACASTGTVIAAAAPGEPRGISLLPRVHVAAVPRDALVETPGDVMRDLHSRFPAGLPSALSMITGPSRSADIVGEVVFGVHGPLAVLVVLV